MNINKNISLNTFLSLMAPILSMILSIVAILIYNNASALQYPKNTFANPHIKLMNYNPDDIHIYTGFYGYGSIMIFGKDEEIKTISMGDTTGWTLQPQGNILFLKPKLSKNTKHKTRKSTNATIFTNKHRYHFELNSEHSKTHINPDIAYEIRLVYPSTNSSEIDNIKSNEYSKISQIPDLSQPENLNFKYSIQGHPDLKPLRVFDDGTFTYIQFHRKNTTIPAIFGVDSEGYEFLLNFRIVGEYVVIERVDSLFTLKNGADHACLFNDAKPYDDSKVKKRNKGLFKSIQS